MVFRVALLTVGFIGATLVASPAQAQLPGWAVTSPGFHTRHHRRELRRHHTFVARHESAHSIGVFPSLNVVSSASQQFRGLVEDLVQMGYNVGRPGCLSSGHMPGSKHHWGGACDLFNQVARNRTALRQPPPSVQIAVAARHGLVSGCQWRSPDCGHFEVAYGGGGRVRYASRHHHRYG